ncbi:MAG: PIG-L family deacetylase [Myxococcota bacterium]
MKHQTLFTTVVIALAACCVAGAESTQLGDVALGQAMRNLGTDLRLMCIAAHPDDEDGATLARYRMRYGLETHAVIATHGEGGQNEIGPELYEELGVIRTHEMPMADDAWMQEILEPNEEQAPRARMPSRPEREGSGHFPHPALVPRSTPATRRSPSSKDLPPATQRTPLDETQARIREAYHLYFALCRKHAQAVVGEETFAQRLHDRLAKLTERYPREKIVFRPVVENGTVRVRVLLAGKK